MAACTTWATVFDGRPKTLPFLSFQITQATRSIRESKRGLEAWSRRRRCSIHQSARSWPSTGVMADNPSGLNSLNQISLAKTHPNCFPGYIKLNKFFFYRILEFCTTPVSVPPFFESYNSASITARPFFGSYTASTFSDYCSPSFFSMIYDTMYIRRLFTDHYWGHFSVWYTCKTTVRWLYGLVGCVEFQVSPQAACH